jgi:hypothetical protein
MGLNQKTLDNSGLSRISDARAGLRKHTHAQITPEDNGYAKSKPQRTSGIAQLKLADRRARNSDLSTNGGLREAGTNPQRPQLFSHARRLLPESSLGLARCYSIDRHCLVTRSRLGG